MIQGQTVGLSRGEKAPAFELRGLDGAVFRSSELLPKGPLLLTFYRGAWCGCCQADFRDVVRFMPELRKRGVTVLGVFCGLQAEADARISREHGLDFPLVNDVDGLVADGFGVRRSPSQLAELIEETGREPLALKGGEPWIVPMQARFLIGSDGVIAHRDVAFNYAERGEMKNLLPLIAPAP